MSTKSSIYYDEKTGVYFYIELLDNTVHLEYQTTIADIDIKIMHVDKWVSLGFPLKTK